MAQEILFRDLEEEEEVPGLSEGERSAMDEVAEDLLQDWVDILSACRQALWKNAVGHPLESILKQRRTQPSTMKDRERVEMPLASQRQATCGVSLQVWDDQYRIHIYVWTQAKHQERAQAAIARIKPAPRNDGEGSLTQTVLTPKEGQLYSDIAEQAATALWALARPVGEAISKQKS